MAIWLPPDLDIARVAVTSGAANVTAYAVGIAAPAAGKRVRLWAWSASVAGTTANPLRTRAFVGTGNPISAAYGDASMAGFADSGLRFLPGGQVFPAATAVMIASVSDVASLQLVYDLYYTVEAA